MPDVLEGKTTAEAATIVRAAVPQDVIAEAAKKPVVQAGQVYDRTLVGTVITGLLIYMGTHVPGHEITLSGDQVYTVGVPAGCLGTMIGAKVPEAWRPWITYTALFLGGLAGVNLGAS